MEGRAAGPPRAVAAGLVGAAFVLIFAGAMGAAAIASALDVGWSWALTGALALPAGLFCGEAIWRWGRNRRGRWHYGPGAAAVGAIAAMEVGHASSTVQLVFVGFLVGFLCALGRRIFGPAVAAAFIYLGRRVARRSR